MKYIIHWITFTHTLERELNLDFIRPVFELRACPGMQMPSVKKTISKRQACGTRGVALI
jgi:hypothetical protein